MGLKRIVSTGAVIVLAGTLSQVVEAPGSAGGAPPGTVAAKRTDERPHARSARSALGNGLGRLVGERGSRLGGGLRVDQDSLAIRDGRGRVLVDLTPRQGTDRAAFRRAARGLGLVVLAEDDASGMIEGFVPLDAVEALAALPDTGTIAQALRPYRHTGSVTSQGVRFQRVDKARARGATGDGLTVAAMSDSYDTAVRDISGQPLRIHEAQDVASRDLPGTGNPAHPDPVVVLQDGDDSGLDEGRAMLQIVHDVAPDADLCFATAFGGIVDFAENIRELADPAGECGADVIVDDVVNLEEPFFSDGLIGDAVDDVVADGASYFSSAGNQGDLGSWSAPVRLLGKQAARRSGLQIGAVDPALYAGGLQDMDPGPGTDVAQSIRIGEAGGRVDLQWNDPVDADGAELGEPFFDETGEITAADPDVELTFTPPADQIGKDALVTVDGIPSMSTDLILTVTLPDGTEVGPIDTGTSPEQAAIKLRQAGTYTITVSGFNGETGDFTATVRPVVAPSRTTTDFNVLAFARDGSYLGVIGDDNTLTGRPSEIFGLGGLDEIQMVIAKTTRTKTPVNKLRYVLFDDLYVAEHYDPLAPTTFGHSTAAGAISVAAWDPFKPYLPESFTSPGGRLPFYFRSDGTRFASPKVRRKPDIAATDGGNTTFFLSDTIRDRDSLPNFFGTSAAAPHAAGIAALMLDRAGGPGSLSGEQVRRRMQRTAFRHDLDPFRAHGSKRKLRITASGAGNTETNLAPGSLADDHFFRVSYAGGAPIRSITFLGRSASPTALGAKGSNRSAGIVFDRRRLGKRGAYRDGGFAFTVGAVRGGLYRTGISTRYSGPTQTDGQFTNLTVLFRRGMRAGQSFAFGIDRDLRYSGTRPPRVEGNSADELGGAVFLPRGRAQAGGLRFVATLADGRTFEGVLRNRLGRGWTPVDGYGVVDAEAAVTAG